jgi:hypothetical protein
MEASLSLFLFLSLSLSHKYVKSNEMNEKLFHTFKPGQGRPFQKNAEQIRPLLLSKHLSLALIKSSPCKHQPT